MPRRCRYRCSAAFRLNGAELDQNFSGHGPGSLNSTPGRKFGNSCKRSGGEADKEQKEKTGFFMGSWIFSVDRRKLRQGSMVILCTDIDPATGPMYRPHGKAAHGPVRGVFCSSLPVYLCSGIW